MSNDLKPTPRTDAIMRSIALANHPETDSEHFRAFMESAKNGVEQFERELDEAKTLAGELIAMIRVNVMRDTFRDATIEQVDEHLKPWIERLTKTKQ